MAGELKSRVSWPGLDREFTTASYSVIHGGTPGVASVVVPEQDLSNVAREGNLIFSDEVNPPLIFQNMLLDRVERAELQGGRGIVLHFLDRRWRWRFGGIAGWYNQTDNYPDPALLPKGNAKFLNGPFIAGTERTPTELLKLCFTDMKEVNYLLQDIPDKARPPCDWYGALPVQALQSVAEFIECRLIFQPNANRCMVAPPGGTATFPSTMPVIRHIPAYDPPEPPSQISVIGGPAWIADYLKLEAVGYDADGSIKPMQLLSYAPKQGGWERTNVTRPEIYITDKGDCDTLEQAKALAKRFCWRTFRVVGMATDKKVLKMELKKGAFGFSLPVNIGLEADVVGFPRIENPRHIIISDRVMLTEKDLTGQFKNKPAKLWGRTYKRVNKAGQGVNWPVVTELDQSFSVDSERGLVTTSSPVYSVGRTTLLAGPGKKTLITYPDLYLYCSFRLRHPDGGQLISGVWTKQVGKPRPDLGPQVIRKPEMIPVYVAYRKANQAYVPTGSSDGSDAWDIKPAAKDNLPADIRQGNEFVLDKWTDNQKDLREAADLHTANALKRYQDVSAYTVIFAGLHRIDPSPAIRQVSWSMGSGPPTTTVSVNTEHAVWEPGYEEARMNSRLAHFITREFTFGTLGLTDPQKIAKFNGND
jgi:hypothetical protein